MDIRTGQALAGWPIGLPMADPDIAGTLLTRQVAVSSLAASSGDTLLFDLRADDAIDSNQDTLPDEFLLRESVVAFWLCPLAAVTSTLGNQARVLDVATGSLAATEHPDSPKLGSLALLSLLGLTVLRRRRRAQGGR